MRTKRTWVGSETDYLGTSKAVTVMALWTNKEGRDIGRRGIPPALETGDVYVLFRKVIFQARWRWRCDAGDMLFG